MVDHRGIIARLEEEEQIRKTAYEIKKMANEREKAMPSVFDTYSQVRLSSNNEVYNSHKNTYDRLKNKIVYGDTKREFENIGIRDIKRW